MFPAFPEVECYSLAVAGISFVGDVLCRYRKLGLQYHPTEGNRKKESTCEDKLAEMGGC